jgi:hypothetical protein
MPNELKAEYRSEGVHFAISGQFATAYDAAAAQDGPMLNGKSFSINAMIPWETLVLKGFPGAEAHWQFGHGKAPFNDDSPDRTRDPRKLHDLLIDQALCSPLVRGEISLAPESALPSRRDRYATSGFLHVNIRESSPGSIFFSDAPRVQILENGFAWSSVSIRSLTIAMLGWSMLEREFDQQDSLSMSFAGDALGWVRYAIDETERVGPNSVHRRIRTMSLRMTLGGSGLEISADGELNDFEPAENPRHREHRNVQNLQLSPIRTYALAATVPWALLAARGLRFADRGRRC